MEVCEMESCDNNATTTVEMPDNTTINVCQRCACYINTNLLVSKSIITKIDALEELVDKVSEELSKPEDEKQGQTEKGFFKTG